MVVIRLAKSGAKKAPYFFITVADSRKPRDGRFIERLGFFNPSARGSEERLRFNLERYEYWVSKGAQPSEKVLNLKMQAELSPEELEKLVEYMPISSAFSFIISAKFSSEPAIPSANATHASFPDAMIIPFKRFSTDTSSFTIINIDEYPL